MMISDNSESAGTVTIFKNDGKGREKEMGDKIFNVGQYAETARAVVAEGIVMLRNEGHVLPLKEGEKIALFGRGQFNYYKSGTGSGGMVNTSYVTGIREALEKSSFVLNANLKAVYEEWLKDNPFDGGAGWAGEPWFQKEMPLTAELAANVSKESDTAIVIIARTAGEDQDNKPEEGSYLLTEAEEEMLRLVCGSFERTVVLLNVGNIIDMKWVERYQPSAVLYVWQGGQEGGNGVLDVLEGKVSPSGKLTDTIAYDITDYPSTCNHGDEKRNLYQEDIYVGYRYFETFAKDKVLYPFGFGLSYTTFAVEAKTVQEGQSDGGQNAWDEVTVSVKVENTGDTAGKEVVQVYCMAPQGALGKPSRSLCGFAKTKELAPGEAQDLQISIPRQALASYDDNGATGNKSCWVLEAGEYAFYVGTDVRSAALAGSLNVAETVIVQKAEEACAPVTAFERMKPEAVAEGEFRISYEAAPLRTQSPLQRRADRLPECNGYTGDKGYKLADVEEGKVSMEAFLAQLSDEELCCIVRGEGMCSPKVTPGTAGAFGGVTESLQSYGIPVACCADGPSGIRMDCGSIAFAMPNGACLGSTFNEELSEDLFEWEALELRKNKVDTLLGPGINVHRNPLNGRNFEYFSEDPFVTGKMAAAQLKAMGRYGVTGTMKHFACNSQEFNRHTVEAVVSERALREIYLKGFEIAVKEGGAYSIMTSYNPINGFWSASNYDMLTTILRGEWGYDGIVMTDWWAKGNDEGSVGKAENVAAMVRAQNDLFMVTTNAGENSQKDNSMESLEKGTVTRAEYVRSAANICRYLLRTPAYQRMMGRESELDKQLAKIAAQEMESFGELVRFSLSEESVLLPVEKIPTAKGSTVTFELNVKERGIYKLDLVCRISGQGSLAQVPLTISQDKQILKTISLTGEDKEWRSEEVQVNPSFHNTTFLKFYFGQGGMEIKEARLTLHESFEERFNAMKAAREEEKKDNE